MYPLGSYLPRQNDAHRYLGWWNVRSLFCTMRCKPHLLWDRFTDMMERNALRTAQTYAARAEMFIDQARRISSEIRAIPKVYIAQGLVSVSYIFDEQWIINAAYTQFFVR
jgi:hypothetical protein